MRTYVQFVCMCVYLEVDCGWPPPLRHSAVMWNNSSGLGSVALYVCEAGYRRVGEGNVSVCNTNAKWSKIDMRCEGTNSLDLLPYIHQKSPPSVDRLCCRPTWPHIVPDLYDLYSSVKHKMSLFEALIQASEVVKIVLETVTRQPCTHAMFGPMNQWYLTFQFDFTVLLRVTATSHFDLSWKYLPLWFTEDRNSYGFGLSWGWVNNKIIENWVNYSYNT